MLLSRVAERLYWAARYLERAEGTARIVREHSNVIVDLPLTIPPNWGHLLGITGGRDDFDDRYDADDEVSIVSFLVADPLNPGSVYSSIGHARENLRTCRDIMPRRRGTRSTISTSLRYVVRPTASSDATDHASWRGSLPSISGCSAS